MTSRRFTITTAIPYVNGDPHLGHALELVQADVLARHRRLRGDAVRFQTGTDDNALKNVEAAVAAGVPVAEFVAARADRFAELARKLGSSHDDFVRTSADPRHRPAVERLWRACAAAGDLYPRDYEGLYCVGCEAFLDPGDLHDGRCPEHATPPERFVERNWFFRLSRHEAALRDLLESGRLRVEPEQRRNEAIAFVRGGLADFSVSRPRERARGWGIPVPNDAAASNDPGQVVYVWFDALANYVSGLDYGTGGEAYETWWRQADERAHVIGKGILRFHAVYWPAILLSAGEPLPTTILVHDYLTVDGRKLSKSLGNAADPVALVERFGVDAVRWWLVRDVPRSGDADFREELLEARANELADRIGNLVARTLGLAERHRPRGVDAPPLAGTALGRRCAALPAAVDRALAAHDLRGAAGAVRDVVDEANAFASAERPWELARAGDARLDAVLATLLGACDTVARELAPFLPHGAARIEAALAATDAAAARSLFPKFGQRARTVTRPLEAT